MDELAEALRDTFIDYDDQHIPDPPVSGDEHPSGLRDAIVRGICDCEDDGDDPEVLHYDLARFVEASVRVWLSVVSEGQIEAAARAIDGPRQKVNRALWFRAANAALAASREVLIPRTESDASVIVGPSKEETR